MPLGFSVEALVPGARVSDPPRMGLVRLGESEWLDPVPDLAARAAAFDAHPDSVLVTPEAEPGIAELANLLGVPGGIEACARSVWEDLCIMVQPAPGEPFRLAAAAVGFPTDWRIAEKLGQPVHAVHAPIPGYAQYLASGVDKFMNGLQSFNLFGRNNAFVVPSGNLRYMPEAPMAQRFAHVTAENAGDTLFVRCEREALRRLPRSRAIVFTIGIYVEPLHALSDAAVTHIASSLAGFGEAELERRGASHYGAALAHYAAARAGNRQAA
ncbi:heme-dependent oxidative N-demethylase subunit alpha family protein [Novosphingobium naphthalenivorans]|uniref:heme-dependent oxidative N-demethylase subunit alpha family protein n=1 Tax=Novosphingobium naphthalenivorans TaxID=273168 RepID=UPI00082CCFD1|nr:heme-dependent oxidative N-demethylase subunit alpha family protein [Novosphingobium naphthalenivorans]